MDPRHDTGFTPPRELGVFVAAPFNSTLMVDQRALARKPELSRRLSAMPAEPERLGVERVVHELREVSADFNDGTGGRAFEPESLVRFDLAGEFELLGAAEPEGRLLTEAARLRQVSVSFHEYGVGVVTGWVRLTLWKPRPAVSLAGLIRLINERVASDKALATRIAELDEAVRERAEDVLGTPDDSRAVLEPAWPAGRIRWSHAVTVWCHSDGKLTDERAKRYARELVIVSDREFVDMCPSCADDFVYIGWQRSILVAPTALDALETAGRDGETASPGLLGLAALRRLLVDWVAAHHLNRALAAQLRDYSREGRRLSGPELRRNMEWIEQLTVEMELYEAASTLRRQMMSPYAFQVYDKATSGWRMHVQRSGYARTLGALERLYQQAKTELEARGRRSIDRGLAILSGIVLISAVYDAWELVGKSQLAFDMSRLGTQTLLTVSAAVFLFSLIIWRNSRI